MIGKRPKRNPPARRINRPKPNIIREEIPKKIERRKIIKEYKELPKEIIQEKIIEKPLKPKINHPASLDRNQWLKTLPKNKVWAELGVFVGDYSKLILEYCEPSKLYLVDNFPNFHTSGNADGTNIRTENLSDTPNVLKKLGNNVEVVVSETKTWLEKLPDNFLDIIYIDDDHSFNAVFDRLELSFYKVVDGGLICGHDYNEGFQGAFDAVNLFCRNHCLDIELITNDMYTSFEIINHKNFPKPSPEKSLQELYDERHGNCDKQTKHSYITLYETLFKSFRDMPITFVELGILSGWSLDLWSRFFSHNNTKIIGIDISPSMDSTILPDFRRQIITGNSTDAQTYNLIDKIDIVIDDASHTLKDQTESFNLLFPRLNIGGIYCIEDIQNESNKNELLLLFPFEVHAFNKCLDDTILIARKT